MGKRRSSRELALQLLYQLDSLISSNSEKALIQESKKEFWENCGVNNVGRDIREYSDIIINGTLDNIEGIDKIIDKYSRNWSISRMSKIDRNTLRISVYESVYLKDAPPAVTINEAVELAKKFGDEGSSAFINGILDSVRIDYCKGESSL